MDNALELAAQLDNTQIQSALKQIQYQAQNQRKTIEKLINNLPQQAEPAILHLQERLNQQIQLSTVGEADPQAFRMQIHERLKKQHGPNNSPDIEQSKSSPAVLSNTPIPGQNGNDKRNNLHQPNEVPGNGGLGNGQGQSNPGNGNHGPDESLTPTP